MGVFHRHSRASFLEWRRPRRWPVRCRTCWAQKNEQIAKPTNQRGGKRGKIRGKKRKKDRNMMRKKQKRGKKTRLLIETILTVIQESIFVKTQIKWLALCAGASCKKLCVGGVWSISTLHVGPRPTRQSFLQNAPARRASQIKWGFLWHFGAISWVETPLRRQKSYWPRKVPPRS